MKQEILDFYEMNNIPVGMMVHVGQEKRGITSEAVRAAAEMLYYDIQGGFEITPIRMAWEVFRRAKHVKGDEISEIQKLKKALAQLENDKNMEIDELRIKIAELTEKLKMPWYKKVMRWINEPMG